MSYTEELVMDSPVEDVNFEDLANNYELAPESEPTPEPTPEPEPEPAAQAVSLIMQELMALRSELAAIKSAPAPTQVAARASRTAGRRYKLLTTKLESWGKIPQQQADIADILVKNFKPGQEFTEADIVSVMEQSKDNYPSLSRSVQSQEHLFRYYLGLGKSDKHAGFRARNFIAG